MFYKIRRVRQGISEQKLKFPSLPAPLSLYWKPGGALGYFLGGYVPPGTPNWHPILEKISPKIDTPF